MLISQCIDATNLCSYSDSTNTITIPANMPTVSTDSLTISVDNINNYNTGLNTWNNYNGWETISSISYKSNEPKYNSEDVNNALIHINSLSQKYGLNVEYRYHVDDLEEMCDGVKFTVEEINQLLGTISTLMNACILNNDIENSNKLCDDLNVVLYFVNK